MAVAFKDVESLLQAMVRLDTTNSVVSGDMQAEQKLLELNEQMAQAMGFGTRRLAVEGRGDNLLVTFEVGQERPWVLFESHMDTVATDGMTIDPFAAEIRDGRIWGRGTCDTKGTGAAMLWALRQYAGGNDRPNNVGILFTVNEEYGMTGVRSFVENDLAGLGFRPRCAIVGEPTMLQPVVAHNGSIRWRIVTRGVAWHSSEPSRGRSAISAMIPVIQTIEQQYIPSVTATHPVTGKAACSVNIIRGGSQINIIPESCEIHIDRRLAPGEDGDSVLPAVAKLLEPLREATGELQYDVLMQCPALCPESSQQVLPIVQQVLREHGIAEAPLGAPYATDASALALAGVPAIVLGPGDVTKAHTKDEWLAVEQLRRGVEVYQGLMRGGW